MATIPIRNRKGKTIAEAIVDDADYDHLMQWRWCLARAKRRKGAYAMRGAKTHDGRFRCVFMHRELVTPGSGLFIDHINGDKLDNRRANLRVCTKGQNMSNQGLTAINTSGFKGVTHHHGKWRAQITHGRRNRHLGVFLTKEAAASAYREAAEKIHGQFTSPAASVRMDHESMRVKR